MADSEAGRGSRKKRLSDKAFDDSFKSIDCRYSNHVHCHDPNCMCIHHQFEVITTEH